MNRDPQVSQPTVAHITTIDRSLRYLLLNQLRSIQEAGYRVVGISAAGPDVPVIEAASVRHIAVPMTRRFSPLADLASLGRLYRVMRRERFTVVHTHTPKPGLLGQLAARLAGVPVVVNTLHGFYFHEHMHPAQRRFYIATERIAARCSDVILSQNSEDIHTAIQEGICSPSQIRYLGNGIDVQRFDPGAIAAPEIARVRAEIGLPDAAPVVGFVGRLVQEKGLLELFAVIREVQKQIPDVHLIVIGRADNQKPDAITPAAAQAYGVADICHFVGQRQDMPELYALMDVFVLPSHREGFPRAPMEASAMQVPCVVSDVRGCREAVQPGRNGLLVPLSDVPALARAIVALLTDGEQARHMGEAGRHLALERFDERRVFATVKAEYARLLREKGLPAPISCE
ncbi:MAG: glycosyltransferase family 4 protein [Chloroflexi bacterium]|nr:glycosyltransferase family 4 protein [Chloroflexota bacterium]MBU1750219.1 glycosyltransferase family 4 protein [Chloroflexota bacterium]